MDSLAFILADAGYDVWMNNNRGNRFSKHHAYYDPGVHEEYWDFSFQEFAQYDQPALFDFVLGRTGQTSVSYIGHSQGTM